MLPLQSNLEYKALHKSRNCLPCSVYNLLVRTRDLSSATCLHSICVTAGTMTNLIRIAELHHLNFKVRSPRKIIEALFQECSG